MSEKITGLEAELPRVESMGVKRDIVRTSVLNYYDAEPLSDYQCNMDDIEKGNFTIPEGRHGIIIGTQNYKTVTVDGEEYKSKGSDVHTVLYVKEENFYSLSRVFKEFGTDSEIYEEMLSNEIQYIIKHPLQECPEPQWQYFTNLGRKNINEVVILTGEDSNYEKNGRYPQSAGDIVYRMPRQEI